MRKKPDYISLKVDNAVFEPQTPGNTRLLQALRRSYMDMWKCDKDNPVLAVPLKEGLSQIYNSHVFGNVIFITALLPPKGDSNGLMGIKLKPHREFSR